MADEAIGYVRQLKEIAPDKPFFVYYVPGATHAPGSRCWNIATILRSSSPARSTS